MTDLKRLDGWRARFDAACDTMRSEPFSWGENDCAVGLVGNLTLALTGADLAAPWRGRYTTAIGALRVLRHDGFADLGALAASILPECHIARARIGDIAAIPSEDGFGFALGVVNGERIFVLTDAGFGTVDLMTAKRAFRVG
ncbi:hypothetical protein [Martelella sp. HB161492]|uniref:DUF6950 family protein n=1 Tax=Martelella sp. HB161492 TaxID=2720726 RepID=UPI001591F629|nr:hypothetical protein [Martelella sp. HB161492]